MPSVRVYQKKQLRLDLLNFRQRQMYELGGTGVAAVKSRLAAAQGPADNAAKPLTKRSRSSRRARVRATGAT